MVFGLKALIMVFLFVATFVDRDNEFSNSAPMNGVHEMYMKLVKFLERTKIKRGHLKYVVGWETRY